MDWEAYLFGLSALECLRAKQIAADYGQDAADRRVRFHPVSSVDDLEVSLRRESHRVRTQVRGLYESIDVNQCPAGWTIANAYQREADGTLLVRTDVVAPNGATGFFERGFNALRQRLELRNAFLRHNGMTDELPAWVTDVAVPMVATRGVPTVQFFTLYQLKLLGVPAGRIRWWHRMMSRFQWRSGPFANPGVVSSIKMSTIQNVETIVHLHWLRQRFGGTDLNELISNTASVEYAATTAIQCGYRIVETKYVPASEWEDRILVLLENFEAGNLQRRNDHDYLLARYLFDRQTVMKQNFDIELSVVPV